VFSESEASSIFLLLESSGIAGILYNMKNEAVLNTTTFDRIARSLFFWFLEWGDEGVSTESAYNFNLSGSCHNPARERCHEKKVMFSSQ
jgi:hypothetical protein